MAVLTIDDENIVVSGFGNSQTAKISWKIEGLVPSIIPTAGVASVPYNEITSLDPIYSAAKVDASGVAKNSFLVSMQIAPDGYIVCYGYGKEANGTYWPAGGSEPMYPSWRWKTLVEPWSWNASNGVAGASGTATAAQTQAAYRAVLNKGELSDFSYLVWNDLVNKVNEAAAGEWLGTTTLAQTRMNRNDKALTATRFNSLRRNLTTAVPEVSPGDLVKGSYFITMAEALNVWIGNL